MSTVVSRWTNRLSIREALLKAARARLAQSKTLANLAAVKLRKEQVAAAERVIARHKNDAPAVTTTVKAGPKRVWHPSAQRVAYASAGKFSGVGGKKIVWHTTEGSRLPTYSGSAPHFTFDPKTGELWQHIPLDESAKALERHNASPTNTANAIQVELIAFSDAAFAARVGQSSRAVANLTDQDYVRIAKLARWIEYNADVPRRCMVKFTVPAKRLTDSEYVSYAGHLGHCHVPQQWAGHWDPATLKIDKIL